MVDQNDTIEYMKAALSMTPNFAEDLNNLGKLLQERKQMDEALACFRQAVQLKPEYADGHNNLGNALRLLGRHEEALASLQQVLLLKPMSAAALSNVGLLLQKLGRYDEALAHYRRALAIHPDLAGMHNNLGTALATLNRHEEAVFHYRRALALNPRYASAHNNLGIALGALNRHAEAVACHEQALALDPRLADAHGSLGEALRTLGRIAESRQALERAVAIAPHRADLYRSLGESKRFVPNDPHLAALEALDKQALPAEQRIYLHFALAKAYADLERRPDAFRHLLEGNRLQRQRIDYDEPETLGILQRTARCFTAEVLDAKAGDPSAAPIFLVGMPRSGSTLVEQMLASHPQVFGAGEIAAIQDLATSLLSADGLKKSSPEYLAALAGEQCHWLGTQYVRQVKALARAAERITNKTLGNFLLLGLIHRALPNARIVHIQRDPIDTCVSCFSKWFANLHPYSYDLAELGRYYRAYETLMEHWRGVLPREVMLEVRYEELVADFEPQARRVVAHCGLDWDSRCLDFHKTERPVKTASAAQVRQPLYRDGVGRWESCKDLLQPLLDALGFKVEPDQAHNPCWPPGHRL